MTPHLLLPIYKSYILIIIYVNKRVYNIHTPVLVLCNIFVVLTVGPVGTGTRSKSSLYCRGTLVPRYAETKFRILNPHRSRIYLVPEVLNLGSVLKPGTFLNLVHAGTSTSSGYTLRVPIIKGTSFRKEEILGS
eukprot:SAG11_NODE_507_length_8879_cov_8.961048_1_plen_134_part_00